MIGPPVRVVSANAKLTRGRQLKTDPRRHGASLGRASDSKSAHGEQTGEAQAASVKSEFARCLTVRPVLRIVPHSPGGPTPGDNRLAANLGRFDPAASPQPVRNGNAFIDLALSSYLRSSLL